jgi:biopolymer transport protein ExbD
MLDLFVLNKKRKDPMDLNVVPILDMLISVIFFLLLTTTFLQFTKQSVPPSSVSKITDPVAPPPVAAKLMGVTRGKNLKILLTWTGASPGHVEKDFTPDPADPGQSQANLLKITTDMITDFSNQYPKEKTIQIGLGEDVSYQNLITIMDGAKEKLPDMVLFSYLEATARVTRTTK